MPAVPNVSGGDGTDVGAVESPINTYLVLNPFDSGLGSLRQAISDANASPGTDLIFFTAPSPITLGSELLVTDCACINAVGTNQVPVSGNNSVRVFYIDPDIDVSFSRMTIQNGNASGSSGGGVYNDHSNVALDRCIVSSNSALLGGGIFNDGSTNGSTGTATLTLSNSTVSDNTASGVSARGAGIYNYGVNSGGSGSTSVALTILNSTLNNNVASTSGGGIENQGSGPGADGHVDIINSTLSANSAGGGGGGGIHNVGGNSGNATVTINNSTLSDNSAPNVGGAVANTNGTGSGTAALNTANTIYKAGASGGTIFISPAAAQR